MWAEDMRKLNNTNYMIIRILHIMKVRDILSLAIVHIC